MQADKKTVARLLNTAKGQIDGVLKMMEEDRYCLDIANQIMAAEKVLHKANHEVILAHLSACVQNALAEEGKEKVEELLVLFDKLSK